MHGWERRMLLKHYLERGVSKAALSRRFGVSRRTIHAWVETGQLDRDLSSGGSRYAPRPAAPHTLDPYTGIIDSRLEEFPGLSAQRLFDEVRAAGYPGGYSRVRDYVRAVRPREPTESVVRFETPAGHQGQVDFATVTLPWGRRHALVVVLSYSRLLWLCFYRRQTMAVLTAGLERAASGWRVARSAGGAVTTICFSVIIAAVRALTAVRRATLRWRIISTAPSAVFGMAVDWPARTARAAISASTVSDFPAIRRVRRSPRFTSST